MLANSVCPLYRAYTRTILCICTYSNNISYNFVLAISPVSLDLHSMQTSYHFASVLPTIPISSKYQFFLETYLESSLRFNIFFSFHQSKSDISVVLKRWRKFITSFYILYFWYWWNIKEKFFRCEWCLLECKSNLRKRHKLLYLLIYKIN